MLPHPAKQITAHLLGCYPFYDDSRSLLDGLTLCRVMPLLRPPPEILDIVELLGRNYSAVNRVGILRGLYTLWCAK